MMVLTAVMLSCNFCYAEDAASAEDKLAAVKEEVVRQEDAIVEIDKQIKVVSVEIDNLNKQLKKITDEGRKLKQELDGLEDERAGLEESLGLLDAGHKSLSWRSRGRIRALFLSRGGVPPLLLLVGGVQRLFTIERNAAYLKKIRSHDINTLTALAGAMKVRKDKIERLKRVIKEQAQVTKKLEDKRSELLSKKGSQEAATLVLKKEKSKKEYAVTQLRAQSVRLEAIVVSLTEGDDETPREKQDETTAEDRSETTPSFFGLFKRTPKKFVGQGITPGDIVQPVRGTKASAFGSSAIEGFGGLIFSKGILYSITSSEAVVAVAQGQVVFSGEMPGYGKVVILDHGERVHTLYARLDGLNVARGDVIDKGEQVGEAQPKEDDTLPRMVYFEYRLRGKPANPDAIFNPQAVKPPAQSQKSTERSAIVTKSQKSAKQSKKGKN